MTDIEWFVALSKSLFRVAPIRLLLVILLALLSQIALMLSVLLPLKIIMLLGVSSIPEFVSPIFQGYDYKTVILVLSLSSVIFFILGMSLKKLSIILSQKPLKQHLSYFKKIALFKDHDKFAELAYLKYVEASASISFSTAAIISLFFIYPAISLLVILCLVLAILFYVLTEHNSQKSHSIHFSEEPKQHPTASVNNFIFFAIFSYIVLDFLYFEPPQFINALVAIIFSRLLLVRIDLFFNHLTYLLNQKKQLDLIFINQTHKQAKTLEYDIWNLIDSPYKSIWLESTIQKYTNQNDPTEYNAKLKPLQLRNIYFIEVHLPQQDSTILIKLFNKTLWRQAQNESILLNSDIETIPMPKLVFSTEVSQNPCHVFDISNYQKLTSSMTKVEFLTYIYKVQPSEYILESFSNSKAMLWEKFNRELLRKLSLFSNHDEVKMIEFINANLTAIQNRLQQLPLFVNIPFNKNALLHNKNGVFQIADCSSWTIEPIGSEWPVTDSMADQLTKLIANSHEQLEKSTYIDIMIAALTYEIERSFTTANYKESLRCVEKLYASLETDISQ